MVRVLILIGALSVSWAVAQAELFGVARDGTLVEVITALDGRTGLTRLVDEYEQDLLMYAASGTEDPLVIRYLVESVGFDVNRITSQRWTPLMYAVRFNPRPEIAEVLIELGAQVGLANVAGQRALDLVPLNPNRDYATHPVARRLIPVAPLVAPAAPAPPPPPPAQRSCCRVCRTGKACGNSCISRSYTCRQGAGCACNGVSPLDPLRVPEIRAVARFDEGERAAAGCDFTHVAIGGKLGATLS